MHGRLAGEKYIQDCMETQKNCINSISRHCMDARKLFSCSFSHSHKHGLLGTLVLALSFSNYGNYHISYYG